MIRRSLPWACTALLTASAACGDGGTEPIENPLAMTQVSSGMTHTCALSSEGGVYCWGKGAEGQLGQGTAADSNEPVRVAGAVRFQSISAGALHSCGLDDAGAAWCWGWNAYYQRGNPTDTATARPVPVAGGLRFTALDAGGNHTCALAADGQAWCWGYNRFGQLGDGTTNTSVGPVRVQGTVRFRQITAGTTHTCGVATSASGGQTWCWGSNALGQLGVGSDTILATLPRRVVGGASLAQVSAGMDHTCGVSSSGVLYCWGGNAHGQLGTGASAPDGVPGALTPTASKAAEKFTQVSAGAETTCGLLVTTGQAFCWGRGESGQLGNGDTRDQYWPQAVYLQPGTQNKTDLLLFRTLSPSAGHTCGTTSEDVLYCWGHGVPGTGEGGYALLPLRVPIGW
jgi:alpha-tubulin suppressor-like RCC1 family protein